MNILWWTRRDLRLADNALWEDIQARLTQPGSSLTLLREPLNAGEARISESPIALPRMSSLRQAWEEQAWESFGERVRQTGVSHRWVQAPLLDYLAQHHIDLVVYSLASPRRTAPDGVTYKSVLKPTGAPFHAKNLDTDKKVVNEVTLETASADDIAQTVKVMGGEDWEMWLSALNEAGVLAPGCKTTSYTYVGEEVTRDIYWDGTIGAAKKDLDRAADTLRQDGFDARVSVLKAVVTQSSSAIPVMPLYLALLFRVMKEQGTHEGCIEQIYRLFSECLYNDSPRRDDAGRNRVDEKEVNSEVQQQVEALWPQVTTENLNEISDFRGFRTEFMQLFGFNVEGVDYEADVDAEVPVNNLVE